jgi:hypothetical protein
VEGYQQTEDFWASAYLIPFFAGSPFHDCNPYISGFDKYCAVVSYIHVCI